jgi:hypothetical protein
MTNKLKGPAIPVTDAKQPNIPQAINYIHSISSNVKALAAAMHSPVRGSTPSPFIDATFYDYTCLDGQNYRFFLKKVNGCYLTTVYSLNSRGSIKKIETEFYPSIMDSKVLPDDFKTYLKKFITNIAFT